MMPDNMPWRTARASSLRDDIVVYLESTGGVVACSSLLAKPPALSANLGPSVFRGLSSSTLRLSAWAMPITFQASACPGLLPPRSGISARKVALVLSHHQNYNYYYHKLPPSTYLGSR
jgi:hypothetical protein